MKVLLADDSAASRETIRHQLQSWAVEHREAAGGEDALALLEEAARLGRPFDVALLDMRMPVMDGLTLAHAIKRNPDIAATRLILLSSLSSDPARRRGAGIEISLPKPIARADLLDALLNVSGVEQPVDSAAPGASERAAPPCGATARGCWSRRTTR